jgi:type I restriction enzyme M protein
VPEDTLAAKHKQQVKCLLYGQEINTDTYAACKADMLLKGEGESADHIVGGAGKFSPITTIEAFPASSAGGVHRTHTVIESTPDT